MPVIPKSMKGKINAFEDVRVLTNKDIYEKVGSRMPQMPKTGGTAMFGLSKVESAALGERLVIEDLAAEAKKAVESAEKSQNEVKAEESAEASETA